VQLVEYKRIFSNVAGARRSGDAETGQAVATIAGSAANLSAAMKKFRLLICLFGLAMAGTAPAQGLLGPVSNEDQFLPVDQAFVFTAMPDGGDRVLLDWRVAPGYYLYRHRVSAKTATPGFVLGEIAMPDGKKKTDEFFGDVEVYYDVLTATAPVTRPEGRSMTRQAMVTNSRRGFWTTISSLRRRRISSGSAN